jgi:signal peptidase I
MARRIVEQALRVLIGFVCSLILLYIASLLALRMIGYEYAAVVSDSMNPMSARGDLVILQQHSGLEVGDVVTFQRGDTRVMHRLVSKVSAAKWKTKGDANAVVDPWKILESEIEQVAVGRLVGFGWPLLIFQRGAVPTELNAMWSGQAKIASAVSSKIFGSTYTSWSRSGEGAAATVYSFGNLTLSGTGEKKLLSRYVLPDTSRLYMNARLSTISVGADFFGVVFNGCPTADGGINCGWYVQLDATGARLRLITSNHQLSGVLANCTYSSGAVVITNINKYIIQRNSNAIYLSVNGQPCYLTRDLQQLLVQNNLVAPTGSSTGFWIRGSTTLRSERTNVY